MPDAEAIPSQIAEGLDLFAAAWLQQWANAGGSVQLDDRGKAWFGFVAEDPHYVEPPADWPEWSQDNRRTFSDGHYHGRMRSMLLLIESVPFGAAAVKLHMRAHGMRSYCGPAGKGHAHA